MATPGTTVDVVNDRLTVTAQVRMGSLLLGDGVQVSVSWGSPPILRVRTPARALDASNRPYLKLDLNPATEGIDWCHDWDGPAVEALAAARALR